MRSTLWSNTPWASCCSSISTALQLRVGVSDTAFPHRSDGCNFLVLSQWMEPTNTDRSIAWARETYAEMEPFVASGRYGA
jgi:hypothetical protein